MELKDNFAQFNKEQYRESSTNGHPVHSSKQIMKFIHKNFYTDIIYLEMPS